MQASTKSYVEFVSGDQSRLEVFAAEKRSTPVSRRLYGQFAEHLFDNVYFGMWAQLLRNPGFEPAHYFGNAGPDELERRLQWRERHFGVPGQLDSYKNGAAYYWVRYGSGDVTYSASDDKINSDSAQKIEIKSLSTPEVGIGEPVFLPTHRTNEYEVNIWTKSTCVALRVSLRTTDGQELGGADIKDLKPEWQHHNVKFRIDTKGLHKGQSFLFTITAKEPGIVLLDQCMLFPSDNMKGFDPDIVRMLKDAKLPLLRFPGGNFVSGYHWKEGVGPVDQRPMRNNPAWNVEEYNHVGTDEWMAFCEMVGCEPMICVNVGNGEPEEAADWVEYCNGDVNTKYGALRAKNGHPKPYGVKIWEVGNELWGHWQVGHCTPEVYADRYKAFHEAMIKRDPGIEFVALGQNPGWNGPVVAKDAKIINCMSTHCLIGHDTPVDTPLDKVYLGLVAFPVWCEGDIRNMTKQMADAGATDPTMAITELMIFTQKRELPDCESLTEVPFYAGFVNMGIRLDGMLKLITRSALVNHGAGLRKVREVVHADPVYYANRLYSTQSGRWPVRIRITAPHFKHEFIQGLPAVEDGSYLDGVAMLDDSGKELNLLITNRYADKSVSAKIALNGFAPADDVKAQYITGPSFTTENSFENPDTITLKDTTTHWIEGMTYTFPPCSLTCLTFRAK